MKVRYYEFEYILIDRWGGDVFKRTHVGTKAGCLKAGRDMLQCLRDRAPEQFFWLKPERMQVTWREYSGTPIGVVAAVAAHSAAAVSEYEEPTQVGCKARLQSGVAKAETALLQKELRQARAEYATDPRKFRARASKKGGA